MPFSKVLDEDVATIDPNALALLASGQFAAPHVPAWIKSLDLRYVHVTPAWERMTGFPRDQVIGNRDSDFRPAELAAHFREQDLRILATGEPETREDRFEGSDAVRSFATSKFPLYDGQGRLIALGGITTETTDVRSLTRTATLADPMLATVIESMPEQVMRFTPDGRITFANASFVMSYTAAENGVVGRTLAEVLPVPLAGTVAAVAAGLTPDAPKAQFDRLIEGADGRERWRQWRLAAAVTADGAIAEIQAICRDVTAERRYQRALERLIDTVRTVGGGRMRLIEEVLDIGLGYFELDVAALFAVAGDPASVQAMRLRPGSPLELADRTGLAEAAAAISVPEDGPATAEGWLPGRSPEAPPRGTAIAQQLVVGGANAGIVLFAGLAEPRAYSDQESMLMRMLAQWLSFALERHQQMAALAASRAELSMIVESVPAYIATHGEGGAVLMANATARALTPPPESMEADGTTVASGRPQFGSLERWDDGGGLARWMRVDRIPFPEPAGAPTRLLMVATDVTELIEKEQALRQANEGLNQFAYVASHDLQEPLRKIGTFTDLLVAGVRTKTWDDVDYAVKVIKDSSRRASALISDLLSWSRLTHRPIERKPVAFSAFVREVVGDVLSARPTILVDLLDEMEPLTIRADVVHVRQLIENLAINAVKYRHPDRKLRIILRFGRTGPGGAPVFEMEDNGIGFDPIYAAQIFEPFRRLHGERQYSGTGVGLAICTRVCERHGWTIRAIGRPDQGATFRVEMTVRSGRAGVTVDGARGA